jgi:hypothetical protein
MAGFLLDGGFVQRLQKMLQWFEHSPHTNRPGGRAAPQILSNGACKIGKLDEALSPGSVATVSVWTGTPSSETDSDENIEAYDWLMKDGSAAIATGKKVACVWANGAWYVVGCECP